MAKKKADLNQLLDRAKHVSSVLFDLCDEVQAWAKHAPETDEGDAIRNLMRTLGLVARDATGAMCSLYAPERVVIAEAAADAAMKAKYEKEG